MFSFFDPQRKLSRVQTILHSLQELGPVISFNESRNLQDLLDELCMLTSNARSRAEVLDYLGHSLDPKSDWRVIENGLRILGALAVLGAHEIFREISQGKHIDVNQRTIILMSYSHEDARVTRVIRSSALVVHRKLLNRSCHHFFVPTKPDDEFGIDEEDDERQLPVSREPLMTPDTSPVDLIDL